MRSNNIEDVYIRGDSVVARRCQLVAPCSYRQSSPWHRATATGRKKRAVSFPHKQRRLVIYGSRGGALHASVLGSLLLHRVRVRASARGSSFATCNGSSRMANGGAASRGPPDGSPAALRGLVQQPLLHAYEARKDPEAHGFGPAEPDGGASSVRTCFSGLNGLFFEHNYSTCCSTVAGASVAPPSTISETMCLNPVCNQSFPSSTRH
jgi:vesicular inhibitory amino acid transporter